MKNEVMICGVDCNPGDGNCNNYCNCDTGKPMADRPPEATPEQVYLRYVSRAKVLCDKADVAVEELRVLYNKQFTESIVSGFKNILESRDHITELLDLLSKLHQGEVK